MKKLLQEFRLTSQGAYSPSPFAAGLFLLFIGCGMMLGALRRLPRKVFYQLQYKLVRLWTGHHNYTRQMAVDAWIFTGYCVFGIVFMLYLTYWLLFV